MTGKHPFSKILVKSKKPIILVGNQCLQGSDGESVMALVTEMSQKLKTRKEMDSDWRVLNVMHRVCCGVYNMMITIKIVMRLNDDYDDDGHNDIYIESNRCLQVVVNFIVISHFSTFCINLN